MKIQEKKYTLEQIRMAFFHVIEAEIDYGAFPTERLWNEFREAKWGEMVKLLDSLRDYECRYYRS